VGALAGLDGGAHAGTAGSDDHDVVLMYLHSCDSLGRLETFGGALVLRR
jgi:hypothetical protein